MDAAILYPDLAFPYYKRFCREDKGSKCISTYSGKLDCLRLRIKLS